MFGQDPRRFGQICRVAKRTERREETFEGDFLSWRRHSHKMEEEILPSLLTSFPWTRAYAPLLLGQTKTCTDLQQRLIAICKGKNTSFYNISKAFVTLFKSKKKLYKKHTKLVWPWILVINVAFLIKTCFYRIKVFLCQSCFDEENIVKNK